MQWLFNLLSLSFRSEIPTSGLPDLILLLGLVIYPILATWGAYLAIKGRDLRRAVLLVSVQPAITALTIIAFALSVMVHAF